MDLSTAKVIDKGRGCSTLKSPSWTAQSISFKMFLAQPFALLNIMVKQIKARTRSKREVFSHLHAQPATPLPVPHTPPPLGLNNILCLMLQLEFLLKPWKKNQRYLKEKFCAMPRTTSPLLRFSEISRDTTEAFPQPDEHPRSPERSLSTTPSC